MILKHLSSEILHAKTKSIAEKERLTTIEVLWHLRENERRMLYAQMGYRDLKEYCVKELKYSEGSAWRRISAMRLLQELPEVEEKIQTGELNLTQISLAKSHFREVKASKQEKQEILFSLENQSARSTERILAELKPETFKPIETERPVKGGKIELTLTLDEDLAKDLDEVQRLMGKSMTKLELVQMMTKLTLESLKKEKLKTVGDKRKIEVVKVKTGKSKTKREAQPAPGPSKRSRYISRSTIREVRARDGSRCQYIDPLTNKQCEAIHHLHIEHKTPFAKGGSSQDVENLELLCAAHNRLKAIQQFGHSKMSGYIPSLQG